jgi:hypothetical protein
MQPRFSNMFRRVRLVQALSHAYNVLWKSIHFWARALACLESLFQAAGDCSELGVHLSWRAAKNQVADGVPRDLDIAAECKTRTTM